MHIYLMYVIIFICHLFFIVFPKKIYQRQNQNSFDSRDGSLFFKNIVDGKDTNQFASDYLIFTAPVRICSGKCQQPSDDLSLRFPLFIGKSGKDIYKSMYSRDNTNFYKTQEYGPFKRSTTKNYNPSYNCPHIQSQIEIDDGSKGKNFNNKTTTFEEEKKSKTNFPKINSNENNKNSSNNHEDSGVTNFDGNTHRIQTVDAGATKDGYSTPPHHPSQPYNGEMTSSTQVIYVGGSTPTYSSIKTSSTRFIYVGNKKK